MTYAAVSSSFAILGAADGNRYRVRMLVGNGVYQGDFYPAEDIARASSSMLGRPVNINHSTNVLDVVGVVTQAFWNAKANALDGEIELNPRAPHYTATKRVIDGTLAAGGVPNVSIEAEAPRTREIIDGRERPVRRVREFLALGIVQVGACNDAAGCGIAAKLSKEGSSMSNENAQTTTASGTATPGAASPETVQLCAKDAALASMKAERDDFATKLAAAQTNIASLTSERDSARTELAKLQLEAERAPIVAELARVSPGFDASALDVPALKACLAYAQSVKLTPPPTGRRTALAADGGKDQINDRVAALRAKMGLSQ